MSRKAKTKEGVILIIDVGEHVGLQDQDGTSFLQKSKQCASKIIQRKIFSDTSDEFSVILIGSKKTQNDLNYSNIEVKNKWLMVPNWKILQSIENLTTTEVNTADWMDGLIVAINLLKTESECKQFSKLKIIMMSNFATPTIKRPKDQLDDVIDSLKELEISLIVIGPEPEENENYSGQIKTEKSDVQRRGELTMAKVVNEAEGVMCGFDEAMNLLDHFQKIVGKAAPWNCDLQIGGNIFIPITGFKKYAGKSLLKWKKRSIEKTAVVEDSVYFESDKQVEKTDVINSYLFGQTVIPMSGDDKKSMALTTERCFEIIGFTKKQNVPRHIFLGDSSHYIVARQDIGAAKKAITALVKGLIELEMVGIVRKVYSKNNAPRIGALIPTCEEDSYFFYYLSLPFAEDERGIKLPSLKNIKPSQEQLDTVDCLIDDMDLSQFNEDEDPYSKLINPSVEHTNNTIIFRALNPDTELPHEPADTVKSLLQPKLEILLQASDTLNRIKNIFCLEEIEQKNYRRGAVDIFDRPQVNSDIDFKDVKPDVTQAMASFVQSTVTEIGTVDPEGNFLKLLERGEPFNKLCDQMQSAIRKLFFISSNAIGIQKPLAALSLLRKHCISQNPLSYNEFISSLKDDFLESAHDDFFNAVVQEKLGLITSEENKDSNVSIDEAETFYLVKKTEPEIKIEDYEMEAEELLDMI